MNTAIRKVSSPGKSDHTAFLFTSGIKPDKNFFQKSELDYIQSEIKKKNRFITINHYDRLLFLQDVDKGTSESYKHAEQLRRAGDQLTGALNRAGISEITIVSDAPANEVMAFAEGMVLGNYQFLKYKSSPDKNALNEISIASSGVTAAMTAELTTLCEAVYAARDLVNEPVASLNAEGLAKAFVKLGKSAGFKVTVFDKKKITSMKMGGLLAVNKGSIDPPTFTVMEWKPAGAVNKKPVVLVGKGVVYDTGGLSLKPTPGSMDYMKSDMAGAAAVGCTLYAIAKQKLPIHVVALVPATDNRPDGNAYTPGDVITMYSGMKIEVLNTDAEGRMLLADALHYAKQYKPELVMEFSTLTGAAANAIGHYGIVCMGDCDADVKRAMNESANNVYERLVEFPYWEEYDELLRSDIADMKNIGGPIGGAITAGRFLSKFTDYPYMHFDIAGPSFGKSNDSYRGKNGTGVGVRFLFEFLKKKAARKK